MNTLSSKGQVFLCNIHFNGKCFSLHHSLEIRLRILYAWQYNAQSLECIIQNESKGLRVVAAVVRLYPLTRILFRSPIVSSSGVHAGAAARQTGELV